MVELDDDEGNNWGLGFGVGTLHNIGRKSIAAGRVGGWQTSSSALSNTTFRVRLYCFRASSLPCVRINQSINQSLPPPIIFIGLYNVSFNTSID